MGWVPLRRNHAAIRAPGPINGPSTPTIVAVLPAEERTGGSFELARAPERVSSIVSKLAWPVIGEQFLQTLVGVADMAIVGRLGAAPVAGIGAATQLVALVVSAVAAVSVGTTVLVARHTGAREPREAGHVTQQSLLIGGLVSIVLAVAGWLLADHLIRVLGAEEAVVREGAAYLRVSSLAWPPLVVMLVAGGALRGAGDTRTPLRASVWMNLINVALAFPLVFGKLGLPALGVAGAALAATIARFVGAALMVTLLLRMRGLSFTPASWQWDARTVLRVLKIGVPTSIEQLMLSLGFLFYGAMVISMGTGVYATQRITFQAINLAFMPAFGYGTATTTLVGQSLGAQRPDLALITVRAAMNQAVFWMIVTGVFFGVFAEPVMHVFSPDPDVITLGAVSLRVLALAQPFWAIGNVYAGCLHGAGDSRYPMMTTSIGMWAIRLPSSYLFGIVLDLGLPGVYLSSVFDSGFRALFNFMRYRKGAWKHTKV